MNRLQYRIVFNKQRGQLMAVAETAVGQTKGSRGDSAAPTRRTLTSAEAVAVSSRGPPSLVALAAAFAMGAVIMLAPEVRAQVKADTAAPKGQQPTVVNSANGTVQVNIQTPSAAGVSRNSYSQFDVDRRGVILNNSRTDVSTQIGGYVQGNPWLARGSARVILNEVHSSAPSQLKGYVEVAGQRAEVIIANPSGIQVDGGGFINASAAVLTTGLPRLNADGSIGGYGVQGGLIRIDGQGLDGSQTDYTALLARAVELNAGIWAKEARIQTGTQVMTVEGAAAGQGAGDALSASGDRPRYALDSTALGGIYAQRITLVGTEAGLGVRQAGQVIGGQLTLRADGWLDNTGTVYAQDDEAATPSLTVQAGEGVRNAGWMAARGSATLQAAQWVGEAGSVTAAGMRPGGTIGVTAGNDAGRLALDASQSVTQAGQLLAAGRLTVQAPVVDFTRAQAQASDVALRGSDIAARNAQLVATGDLSLAATASLDLTGAQAQSGTMTVAAPALAATGAQLSAAGTLRVDGREVDLSGAGLWSNGALSARGSALTLDGAQAQARSLRLEADGALSVQRATLGTTGAATWTADRIDARSARVTADGGVAVQAGTELRLDGGELQAAAGSVSISGAADIRTVGGVIAARDAVSVQGRSWLQAQGASVSGQAVDVRLQTAFQQEAASSLLAARGLDVNAASIDAKGLMRAGEALSLTAGEALTLRGPVLAADARLSGTRLDLAGAELHAVRALTLRSGTELITDNARLSADSLSLQAHDWRHAGGLLSLSGTGEASIALEGRLDNRAGVIRTNARTLAVTAQSVANAGGKIIGAGGSMVLRAQALANEGGTVAAARDLAVNAETVTSTGILAAGLRADGTVGDQGHLTVTARTLQHSGIAAAGGAVTFDADTAALAGSRSQASSIAMQAHAGPLDLSQATVAAAQSLSLQSSGAIDSSGATLSGGSFSLIADRWQHAAGRLVQTDATGTFDVAVAGALDQQGGRIAMNAHTASLTAGHLSTVEGDITHAGTDQLRLTAQQLSGTGAGIVSAGALAVHVAGAATLDRAQVQGRSVTVDAGALSHRNGQLISQSHAALTVDGLVDNRGGALQASDAMTLRAASLANDDGRIDGRTVALTASETLSNGGQGLITAAQSLRLDAGRLDNAGSLQSEGDAVVRVAGAVSQTGHLYAQGGLTLTSGGTLTHTGLMAAQGYLNVRGETIASTGTFAAGLKPDNTRAVQGELSISASGTLQHAGITQAAGRAALDGGTLLLQDSQTAASSVQLQASGGAVRLDRAVLSVADRLALQSASTLHTEGARMSGAQVAVTAAEWRNAGGQIGQTDAGGEFVVAVSGRLDNQGGRLSGNGGTFAVSADHIDNTGGQIVHASPTGGELRVTGTTLSGVGGTIATQGTLAIGITAHADVTDARIQAQRLELDAGQLRARGAEVVAASSGRLTAKDELDVSGGLVQAGSDLALRAGTFINLDGHISGHDVALAGGVLNNAGAGLIAATGKLSTSLVSVHNAGAMQAGGDVDLRISDGLINSGSIRAAGAGRLEAASISNTGTVSSRGSLTVRAGDITGTGAYAAGLNADRTLTTAGDLTLIATGQLQNAGTLLAGGALTGSGASMSLQDSRVQAQAVNLSASAGDLQLDRTVMSAGDRLNLTANGALLTTDATLGAGSVVIAATDWRHQRGQLAQSAAGGELRVTIAQTLTNEGGAIAGNAHDAVLQASRIDHRGGVLRHAGEGTLALTAQQFDGAAGEVLSKGALSLHVQGVATLDDAKTQARSVTIGAGSLSHRDGRLLSQAGAAMTVQGLLDNTQGRIDASEDLRMDATVLDNTDGQLSGRALVINNAGRLINGGQGLISAAQALTVSAGQIDSAGTLQSQAAMDLTVHGRFTQAGAVTAGGPLTMTVDGVLGNSGTIASQGSVSAQAGSIVSSGGWVAGLRADQTLGTLGDLTLRTTGTLQHSGQAIAAGALTLSGADLQLQDAKLQGKAAALSASGGDIRLDRASLAASGDLGLTATGAIDSGAAALSGAAVSLAAQRWSNVDGRVTQIGASGSFTATVQAALNNTRGEIAAGGATLALNAGAVDNTSGRIVHAGTQALRIHTGTLAGGHGEILGTQTVALNATGAVDLNHAKTQGAFIDLQANSLAHQGGQLLSSGDLQLRVQGGVDHTGGAMGAVGDLHLQAAALDNSAGQIGARAVALTVGSLTNGAQGLVNAQTDLTISGVEAINAGNLQSGRHTRLTLSGALSNAGHLYAQGDALMATGLGATNTGMVGAQGALTLDAASLSGTGTWAAGLRADNTFAARGDLTVRTGGTLQGSGTFLAAGALSLRGGDLQLQDSRMQAATAALNALAGASRLDRAVLASSGDLMLASAGLLSTEGATLSAANVGLTAADWRHTAGSLSQTGTEGSLLATVSGQINNTDGRVNSAGAQLNLQAQGIHNLRGQIVQAGAGALTLATGTLQGDAGQILGNGAVAITATGAVSLTQAQTQGDGVTLTGSSLDHQGGRLVSQGGAVIDIGGATDNRGGTLASAGLLDLRSGSLVNGGNGLIQSDATLRATIAGNLDNQGGRLRSGGAMDLSAGNVDNRSGWAGSDGTLTVNTGGALLNAGGTWLAQGAVSLNAATLGNQSGRISSLQQSVTLRAQGAIDNIEGVVQAAQTADLGSSLLSNVRGEISGGSVVIDTRGLSFYNSGGKLLASQSLTVHSGALQNHGGLMQSLGSLSVQTGGAELNNTRDASVSTPAGIRAQGAMTLNAGMLVNEQGISAGTVGQVQVAALTNRAELSATALDVAVGGVLDNRGGRVIGAQSLEAAAHEVLNQGGLMYGAQTLNLSAADRIDNTGTTGASQGIQGGHVSVRAAQLDNTGGQVLASGHLGLTVTQAIHNASGALGAAGMQTIGDGAGVSALSLNNAGGRIWSGEAMGLNLRELVGGVGGQVSSAGTLTVKLAGDFSYGAGSQFQSGGDLVLNVAGQFANQGTLRSGGTLTVTAAQIDNAASGELSGVNTLLTAAGQITNRGLIDGDGVMLTTDRLVNVGTGRIYGGDIVLEGGQWQNGAEGNAAAVLAARRSIDATFSRDVSNAAGALIFADGDLQMRGASLVNENATIEASRSVNLQLTGGLVNRTVLSDVVSGQTSASGATAGQVAFLSTKGFIRSGGDMSLQSASLLNSGATIEARGNLLLQANTIDNVNPYLAWKTNPGAKPPYVRITYSPAYGMVEHYYAEEPLNGRTAEQAALDWSRSHPTDRIEEWSVAGGEGLATVTQSLAANVIVGGQLTVLGASSITNDMSRVVGYTGVDITGGMVNNVKRQVQVVDAQGVTQTVSLTLPSQTQSPLPTAQGAGGRQQAGTVTTGGGAATQQSQGGALASASGGSGLGGLFTRLLNQVNQGNAAQPGAQGRAQWLNGRQIGEDAVNVGPGAGSAGTVQGAQRSTASVSSRAVTAAAQSEAGSTVQAQLRQTRESERVQAEGAQTVRGAAAMTQWRDGDSVSARVIQPSQASGAGFENLSTGASSVDATVSPRPGSWQGPAPRASGATFNGFPQALTVRLSLTPPSNSLFKTHKDPASRYLVETDPRFANYREWLSSDFLLQAMALDPAVTQKRLGDGFYEQRLVREQIGQLTGTGYLSGFADDEAQYRSLLTSGATFARAHQLVPGIALTAEQMTQLTSDLVWLVEQEVTLADGTVQRVLVPQVYLMPREGDLLPSGSLIAGGRVGMALSGDFNNGGSVRAGVVDIQANNIANTGDMRATTLALTAREDLRNIGGQLAAAQDMRLTAGRDIVMQSTTATGGTRKGNVTTTATVLDQVASLTAGGVMVLKAGQDVSLQAVKITQGGLGDAVDVGAATAAIAGQSSGAGGVLIQAGRDLSLTTVQTASTRDEVRNATNYKKESRAQDVGTEIKAEGAVALKAGQDLKATAAQIASADGAVTLAAGRDVSLLAGETSAMLEEMTQKTKKSFLKKKTVTTYTKSDETTAIGTTLSGDTVQVAAGRDITLAAAQVVSDSGTKLIAERDITIDGVTNALDTEQFKKTVKSGLMSGGGIGITIGKQALSQTTKTTQETHQGSTVASVSGDVDILAGGHYRQIGSEVQAPKGDVSIQAEAIDIVEARNQSVQDTQTAFKQSGLSVSLSAPGVDAAMGSVKAAERVTQTQDDRMKALAAATAISKAKQAVEEIQKFEEMANADKAQSVRISLSLGSQQSKSSQHNESNQAAGSSVLADGKLSLIATGGGQDSSVTVRGSTLAGQDVLIKADNEVNLLASQNTSEQHSKDSSRSASIGVGVSLGGENRIGFTASGSVSKGNADGKDTSYSATQVSGGRSVTLQSGGNTTLGGAVVTGPKVVADIAGNLKIESLQDTAKFDSKSQSIGGSVTFGYGQAGGSANFSQSKVNADYAAVGEQAGIRAGDGGFQVSVKGSTELKGGAITSNQAAIDAGKNSFSTGTLTSSDIDNRSQFTASAVTVSAGTSGGMAGAFKDSGDERSTTRSTVSAGSTTITSGDAGSQAVLAKLDRGATSDATTGKLAQGWDGQKLGEQGRLNAQVVAEFGAEAAKRGGAYATSRRDALREEAVRVAASGDKEQAEKIWAESKKWEEGGAYRVAMHGVIGGLSGGVDAALGGVASQAAVPVLAEKIRDSDLPLEVKQALMLTAGTAIGAAVGGADGAFTGFNATDNNFLSDPNYLKKRQALKVLDEDESKNWARRLLSPTSGLLDAAQVQQTLQAMDMESDRLLKMYRSGAAMSNSEVNQLAVYLGEYAQSNGRDAAQKLVKYGPQPSVDGSLENPGWTLSQKAESILRVNAVHDGQAAVGTPALEVLAGPIGNLARLIQAAQSSTQIGLGIGAIKEGDTAGGMADVGLGLLGYTATVGGQYVNRAGAAAEPVTGSAGPSLRRLVTSRSDGRSESPTANEIQAGGVRSNPAPISIPINNVLDFAEKEIPTFQASEQYSFRTSKNIAETGASLESASAAFVKDEAGNDFIALLNGKHGNGNGIDLPYAKLVNGKPVLILGEAKAGDSALTSLGENRIQTLDKNLSVVRKSILETIPVGPIRNELIRQLDSRTYQVEIYVSPTNASKTASRIDELLEDRIGSPISRVVVFPKKDVKN